MKLVGRIATAALAAIALAAPALPQATQTGAAATAPAQQLVAKTNLKVGDMAPDFTLRGTGGREPVKLSDFRGKKNVVLAFYVLAFTGG